MGWGGEGAEFHPFLVLTARVTGSTAAARQGMSSGRIICCQLQWVERLFCSKRQRRPQDLACRERSAQGDHETFQGKNGLF